MRTALIVEDDPYLRTLVVMIVEETLPDAGIVECVSAEAGVSVLDFKEIDLLITDIQLTGEMSGVKLARITKDRYPNAHIIVTSGRALHEKLPSQATFLAKPWRPLQLIQQLNR